MSRFSEHMNSKLDELQAKNTIVIDVNKLAEELYSSSSMDHMTIGDLKMAYTKARIAVALYERGCRSVIRGFGYYVNPADTNRKEYIEKIHRNAELSKQQKETAIKILNKAIKNNKNVSGQFEFDIDGNIVVSKSDEEILEILSKEA